MYLCNSNFNSRIFLSFKNFLLVDVYNIIEPWLFEQIIRVHKLF